MSMKSTLVPALVLLSAVCINGQVMAENLQGHAKGHITRDLALTGTGAPLLQSFYFRFTKDDHHLTAIEVVPNAPAVNKASLGYYDKNQDDEFFFNVTFAPYFGEIFRQSHEREFCNPNVSPPGPKGSCTFPIQGPPNRADHVFVLRGFNISYRVDDHHIDQIRIQENNGQVTVALNDKNDDDMFYVDLHYAYIPRSRFSVVQEASGTSKGGHKMDIAGGTPVIRGFNFDFKSEDHHIKDIGVVLNGNGRLEVYYGDKNQDDLFDWQIQYAILSQ